MSVTGPITFSSSRPRRRGMNPAAVILIVFGSMFFFIGVLLGSLCLVAGGILCEDTFIGGLGFIFLLLGGLPLLLGIILAVALRRRAPPADAAVNALASASLAQRLTQEAFAAPTKPTLEQDAAGGPVASNCPECGAPVPRGASVCTYCGETFA